MKRLPSSPPKKKKFPNFIIKIIHSSELCKAYLSECFFPRLSLPFDFSISLHLVSVFDCLSTHPVWERDLWLDLRRWILYAITAPDQGTGHESSENVVTKDDSLIMSSAVAVL